ncbi:FecR family protein [Sphingomonas sp. PAMC 26617]|uniref:FecR family protein n=1 Tax=Sphingomonas sp. PAMC 26617 TaxID=1112216 RepID=UPI000288F33E|nr:DUF4880 domain-containing protein [Sphingomonas sp. PAMC 26617]
MTERLDWEDDLARLRLEGLDHLTRLRSGEATDHDAAAFITWRATSPAHEEAFRSAIRLTRLIPHARPGQPSRTCPAANDDGAAVASRGVLGRPLSRRGILGGALAASVAGGAVFAGRTLDVLPAPSVFTADVRTGPGERRRIRLAGGALADLNTRTSVGLRTGLGMPAIDLIDGEAIIADGPSARAAVLAGPGQGTVTAGRMSARRDGDQVCITCLEGTVAVAWSGETRRLEPSEAVRYDRSGIGAVERGADPAVLTAWQRGTLIFHDMPMRDVVVELNRYRAGRIFLADRRLADRRLSGTYAMNRLDAFFDQAELGLGVRIYRLPGNVVILT